jgi:Leucine Rich repeat
LLTKVSLNGNGIGSAGAVALADMLQMNASLRELGLGRNNVGNEGAAAIAEVLRFNETLERLNLGCNSIGDVGAMAIFKALTESTCSLMWLNLEDNADVSAGLQKRVAFAVASRRVLKSFRNCLGKPLEKVLMPLVIRAVRQGSICHEKREPGHCQEIGAGPIFLLVRSAALNDSKVFKGAPPSRKRSRSL